jgi:hypothetical protein
MKAGTSKDPMYYPIHEIHQSQTGGMIKFLLPFHALTGCDNVSQFAGHTKESAWKVLLSHQTLLTNFINNVLSVDIASSAEAFVYRLYRVNDLDTCNKGRGKLFWKFRSQESLPPTPAAVQLHTKRAHYQTQVCIQAAITTQNLPNVPKSVWISTCYGLTPQLITLPASHEACLEIIPVVALRAVSIKDSNVTNLG